MIFRGNHHRACTDTPRTMGRPRRSRGTGKNVQNISNGASHPEAQSWRSDFGNNSSLSSALWPCSTYEVWWWLSCPALYRNLGSNPIQKKVCRPYLCVSSWFVVMYLTGPTAPIFLRCNPLFYFDTVVVLPKVTPCCRHGCQYRLGRVWALPIILKLTLCPWRCRVRIALT